MPGTFSDHHTFCAGSRNAGVLRKSLKKAQALSRNEPWYLEDDDGDDGHLRAEPREETLQLTTLTNQVTIHYDGNQTHGFHRSL